MVKDLLHFYTDRRAWKTPPIGGKKCPPYRISHFGSLYNLQVWVDQVLSENEFIVFEAGSHLERLKIKYHDYARLVNPKMGDFSEHL
jgi:prolyl-tRNA editing enzyme YbaK/EbsC (Cys-tRNA(Pro) deacylase)